MSFVNYRADVTSLMNIPKCILESLNYQQPVFPILSLCVCVNVLFWEVCCAHSSFGIIHDCTDSFWNSVSSRKSFCVLISESFLDLCWLLRTGQRYWTGIPGKRNCLLVCLTFCSLCAYQGSRICHWFLFQHETGKSAACCLAKCWSWCQSTHTPTPFI